MTDSIGVPAVVARSASVLRVDPAALLGAGDEVRDDYAAAGVPMLPVVAGPEVVARKILPTLPDRRPLAHADPRGGRAPRRLCRRGRCEVPGRGIPAAGVVSAGPPRPMRLFHASITYLAGSSSHSPSARRFDARQGALLVLVSGVPPQPTVPRRATCSAWPGTEPSAGTIGSRTSRSTPGRNAEAEASAAGSRHELVPDWPQRALERLRHGRPRCGIDSRSGPDCSVRMVAPGLRSLSLWCGARLENPGGWALSAQRSRSCCFSACPPAQAPDG